jgi:UDP-N-acetylmuramate dehydrogenase
MDAQTRTEVALKKLLGSSLESHVALQDRLAFGVGGVADFLTTADTLDELIQAVTAAQTTETSYLIIGQGSQVIVSDYGFPGLVILNRTSRVEFVPTAGQVIVESGATWPTVILQAASRGLSGFETLLALPGSVGGTLLNQRLGPTGFAAHQALRSVTLLSASGSIRRLSHLPESESGNRGTLLVASLQLVQTRRDELLRRIRTFEVLRRRLAQGGRRWLGPVFHSDFAGPDPSYLLSQFQRAKVLDFRLGGAIFSTERPNFIEARGRVTARMIRELSRSVYDRLLEVGGSESLTSGIQFVGSWGDEVES